MSIIVQESQISNVHLMLRIIRQPHINQTLLINHKKAQALLENPKHPHYINSISTLQRADTVYVFII